MALMFGRDYTKGPIHLKRALQLNPNQSNAHGIMAAFHGVSRDYAAARDSAERATTLSPRDPYRAFWYGGHGIAAFLDRNYDRCIEICHEVLAEFPSYASSLRQLAAAQAMAGRQAEAKDTMKDLLALMPGLTVSMVRDIVPIRYPDDHEHWLEGLRRAGMPD